MDEFVPFVTPADVANYTNGKISATDPRVSSAIAGASAAVRRYCGWHIYPLLEADELVLDGPGGRELDLPSMNVQAVQSITQNATLLDESAYAWSQLGQVKLKCGYWCDEYRSITAVIDHGYGDVSDIQRVVLAMVSRELSSPSGATREQAGQVSVSWAVTAPGVSGGIAVMSNEYAVLDAYRIVGA